jgi:hypothetical protein
MKLLPFTPLWDWSVITIWLSPISVTAGNQVVDDYSEESSSFDYYVLRFLPMQHESTVRWMNTSFTNWRRYFGIVVWGLVYHAQPGILSFVERLRARGATLHGSLRWLCHNHRVIQAMSEELAQVVLGVSSSYFIHGWSDWVLLFRGVL